MARETIYLVQAYTAKGDGVRAETPVACGSAEAARRMALKLAPSRAGIVAFSIAADTELGEYDDDPTIIFKAGILPPPFDEA